MRKTIKYSSWIFHYLAALFIILKLQSLIFFCLDLLQTAVLNINKLTFLLPQQLRRQEHWNTWTVKKRTVSAHKSQSTILQDGGNMDNSPNMKPLVHIESMFPYSRKPLQSLIKDIIYSRHDAERVYEATYVASMCESHFLQAQLDPWSLQPFGILETILKWRHRNV